MDGIMSAQHLKSSSPQSRHRFLRQALFAGVLASITPVSAWAQDFNLPTIAQDTYAGEHNSSVPKVRYITRDQMSRDLGVVQEIQSREIQLKPLDVEATIPVVTALAATTSGAYLAAAGDDHAIRIIDTATGIVRNSVGGHTDWIHALVFSATERSGEVPVLYSAGDDGTVLRWEQSRQAPIPLVRFDFAIRSLSLSSERGLLAVGGFGPQIVLYDIEKEEYKFAFSREDGDQRCVRFSPDGSKLLSGGRDGSITVWDTSTGEQLAHYQGHHRRVQTASFSSDGNTVTSVGSDRRLSQYNLTSKQLLPRRLELPAKLMSMCLINDSVVAVAGADNSIQLYDFKVDKVVADLREHSGTVAVMCSYGNSLASGAFDTTVRIWDLKKIEAIRNPTPRPVNYTPLDVDEKLRIR